MCELLTESKTVVYFPDYLLQTQSRSINKSFGIFNEKTLRHRSTNVAHDISGYRSLIARPYESVNRAMPGSYYSDVERTIYLTYYILVEDIAKYDELFQQVNVCAGAFLLTEYYCKAPNTVIFLLTFCIKYSY